MVDSSTTSYDLNDKCQTKSGWMEWEGEKEKGDCSAFFTTSESVIIAIAAMRVTSRSFQSREPEVYCELYWLASRLLGITGAFLMNWTWQFFFGFPSTMHGSLLRGRGILAATTQVWFLGSKDESGTDTRDCGCLLWFRGIPCLHLVDRPCRGMLPFDRSIWGLVSRQQSWMSFVMLFCSVWKGWMPKSHLS